MTEATIVIKECPEWMALLYKPKLVSKCFACQIQTNFIYEEHALTSKAQGRDQRRWPICVGCVVKFYNTQAERAMQLIQLHKFLEEHPEEAL